MFGPASVRRLLALLTAVGLVAACAAGAGSSPSASVESSPTATVAPSQTPTTSPTVASSTGAAASSTPVHITSLSTAAGLACSSDTAYCVFVGVSVASDPRLSGCYVLRPTSSTTDATRGTVEFASETASCQEGYVIKKVPEDELTWDGEWFTTGWRAPRLGANPDDASTYPIDTMWLHGRGENAGLSAVLRIKDPAHGDGWIFRADPR